MKKSRNILKNGPKKWSHAAIKNRNWVYGNKGHVKQWFKKWKNRPKNITRHALRRKEFCRLKKTSDLHGVLNVFWTVEKSGFLLMYYYAKNKSQ